MEYKLVVLPLLFSCLGTCLSLTINNLNVPSLLEFGTKNEVILDCDYELKQDEIPGLVVKWFLQTKNEENNQIQVYQWIMNNRAQDLGLLRGRLNTSYQASSSPEKMYRALYIKDLDPKLSGNYTCVVSTFFGEVHKSKAMIIYSKEENFDLKYKKVDENTLEVMCSAENIYPRPNITIYKGGIPYQDSERENITTNKRGFWDISTSVLMDLDTMDETLVCNLAIPEADYSIKLEVVYSGAARILFTSMLLLASMIIITNI